MGAMTTMTTVGYGDITPTNDAERGFAMFAMIIGASFYGYAVGAISSIVATREFSANAYHLRMDTVFAWLEHHNRKLPQEVHKKVVRYFKLFLAKKAAID